MVQARNLGDVSVEVHPEMNPCNWSEKKGAAKEDFATISATVFPMVYQTSEQFPMKEISFKITNQKRAIVIILKLVRKPNPKRPHVVT